MNKQSKMRVGHRILFFLLFGIVIAFVGSEAQAANEKKKPLFTEDNSYGARTKIMQLDQKAPQHVKRGTSRAIKPDFTAMQELSLLITLPNGTTVEATRDSTERSEVGGAFTWLGHLTSDPNSSVIVTTKDNVMVGTITNGKQVYQVAVTEEGSQVVRELDQSKRPPHMENDSFRPIFKKITTEEQRHIDAEDAKIERLRKEDKQSSNSQKSLSFSDFIDTAWAAPTNTIIRVGIAYEPSVRQAAGGTAAVQALISKNLAISNRALIISQVYITLQLAFLNEISEEIRVGNTRADMVTMLGFLSTPNDGKLDIVHLWRSQTQADLVMLVTAAPSGGGAWGMSNLSVNFAPVAFSMLDHVYLYDAPLHPLVMVHEFAHNMGSVHDRANSGDSMSSTDGIFPYSHGLRVCGGNAPFLTVMSIGSADCYVNYIPYFSNPNISYKGKKIGIVDQADNARSLNNARFTVDAFGPLSVDLFPTVNLTAGPASGAVGQPLSYTATANDVNGNLTRIDLLVSPTATESWTRLGSSCTFVAAASGTCTRSWTPPAAGTYRVVVIGYDAAGHTCTGFPPFGAPPCGPNDAKTVTITAATTDTTPPGKPTLVAPVNGRITADRTPTFDWNNVTDPSGVTYRIGVDNNSDFSSREINKSGLTASTFTPSTALAPGKYYWRVRAIDKTGNAGPWSFIRTVTVK